jgi:basic amino acid/polyamine antiporter, APA family
VRTKLNSKNCCPKFKADCLKIIEPISVFIFHSSFCLYLFKLFKLPLNKTLTVRDLTAFGIAAIIGAGIFSTIGKASYSGGPGVVLLFIGIAVACSFTGLAYAEFASIVPLSGSAYSYVFHSMGKLAGWLTGWALIMEYAIGNITYAISWSDYFTSLAANFGWQLPDWITMDYFTAKTAFGKIEPLLQQGADLSKLAAQPDYTAFIPGYRAWINAPALGAFRFIVDIPAVLIVILVTMIVFRGMRGSRNASNAMVFIKITAVLVVLAVGAFYINTDNWTPFVPNGIPGILGGTSAVFFAYIGFDAISTTSEECVNPQRDIPRAIIYALIICTTLYILMALVLTGMVSYKELNLGDPLAYVFTRIPGLHWLSGIISISAVVAITSVLLIYQLGQPRIWLAMGRDGMLPKAFARIHPKYGTPSFATIMTGIFVAVPTLFLDLSFVTDVSSMGTLFSFTFVCAGILFIHIRKPEMLARRQFKIPFVNARWIVAPLFLLSITAMLVYFPGFFAEKGGGVWAEKIPMLLFFILFAVMAVLSFRWRLSLFPVLGLLSCTYMMAQLGGKSWFWFGMWMVGGGLIFVLRNPKAPKASDPFVESV